MRQWIDIVMEGASFSMPIAEIELDRRAVTGVFKDILQGQLSHTSGPVALYTTATGLALGDGYHRVIQAILGGRRSIRARLDRQYATEFGGGHPWTPKDGFETLGFSPDEIAAARAAATPEAK